MSRETPLDYLALGDSYTIGEGVAGEERWTTQLSLLLREHGVGIAYPRTIATTGWTCDELLAGIMAAVPPPGTYDFASVLIGVNDQYRGHTVDFFAQRFAAVIDKALSFVGGDRSRVLVLGIPDWGVTPFAKQDPRGAAAIAAELDAYNAAIAAYCATHSIAFVDPAAVSRALCANPANLTADGLHPGAAIYRAWAEMAVPVALDLLRRH